MSCIQSVAKYVIFLFNFVIAICAVTLIVFGIIYVVDESSGVNVFDISWFSLGALAIAVGVIIFLIASFGCCGAINESNCLLTTYAVVLLLLFAVQVTLGVLAIVKIKDQDAFFDYVTDLIQDLFENDDAKAIKTFHALQVRFQCCGVNGSADYETGIAGWPKSCCEKEMSPCFFPYEEGCATAFTEAIRDNIVMIGYVACGFAVVEFLGAIFAFMVRKKKVTVKEKLESHA